MARDTLRYGLYAAAIAVLLALTGIFASFESRYVIANRLTLSMIVLGIMLVGAAFVTGSRARKHGSAALWVSAVGGSVIVGAALALLVVIEANVDLRFIFPSLNNPIRRTLTFGQEDLATGLLILMGISVALGLATALLLSVPARLRRAILYSISMTLVLGLLESQVRSIMTLPDSLAIALAFTLGYIASRVTGARSTAARLLYGALAGGIVGAVLGMLALNGAVAEGGLLAGMGTPPVILSLAAAEMTGVLIVIVIFAFLGIAGSLITVTSRSAHDGMIYGVIGLVIVGVLNSQRTMNDVAALISLALFFLANWFLPPLCSVAAERFQTLDRSERSGSQRLVFAVMIIILLVAPLFVGQYITDVLNLVGLYIILGIGLNITVGNAGLLNLGHVAFFAIGAYTAGLLMTPSLLTCGGVPPRQITPETVGEVCTILTFWQALPISVLVTGLAGALLGIPILRLRGDYLAIVTLGFGEIIRLVVRFDDFKDLFGAAQGIANIPRPVLDLTALNPAWRIELTGAAGIYYLVLASIVIVAIIATRLAVTRLGRAWLALRADEDVAQAMGINLVQAKLLAFAIGAAFAGMAGAIGATRLYGAYPDSYVLLVSINVLSLIIIGGLGSIPGVIVGAMVLVGLPEVLRELSDYRLLAFGILLVVVMLIRPQGLIPPSIRRLSEIAGERAERRAPHMSGKPEVKEGVS
jgi:branched-chain amino acid transport system permease protein